MRNATSQHKPTAGCGPSLGLLVLLHHLRIVHPFSVIERCMYACVCVCVFVSEHAVDANDGDGIEPMRWVECAWL